MFTGKYQNTTQKNTHKNVCNLLLVLYDIFSKIYIFHILKFTCEILAFLFFRDYSCIKVTNDTFVVSFMYPAVIHSPIYKTKKST